MHRKSHNEGELWSARPTRLSAKRRHRLLEWLDTEFKHRATWNDELHARCEQTLAVGRRESLADSEGAGRMDCGSGQCLTLGRDTVFAAADHLPEPARPLPPVDESKEPVKGASMRLNEVVEQFLQTMCETYKERAGVAMMFNLILPDGNIVCFFPEHAEARGRAREQARAACRSRGAIAVLTITPFGAADADGHVHMTGVQALLESRTDLRVFEWSVEVNGEGDPMLEPVRQWAPLTANELERVDRLLPCGPDGGTLPEADFDIEDLLDNDF